MNHPVLELRDVSVRYGTPTAPHTLALDAATLSVAPGECVGIAGGPGSGTTTLLLCASGLIGADAGSVRWFGSHRWHAGRAAYESASADGHPYLSVRAWLEFSASQREDDALGPEPDVEAVMSLASLCEFARIRVGHLTPGVSARVALAGALLGTPRIVMFDRPFDALSCAERARLAQVLGSVLSAGVAVVVTTRVASLLGDLSPSRIHYLAGGRLDLQPPSMQPWNSTCRCRSRRARDSPCVCQACTGAGARSAFRLSDSRPNRY
ncbi:MAG: ATP-binding cassette domain-containing protein [Gemmatimonadetes bacterium]|nr:ATP-binding cassette domain-containing protein [Gemmatimonadota bacterium]